MSTEHKFETVTEGEFAGWVLQPAREDFNGLIGPYYYQIDDLDHVKVAFRCEKHHLNGGGSVHGGCLLTLADTSLFIFAQKHLEGGSAVTMQLDAQFQSPGFEGDIVIATGEITRAGKSVIFGRGRLMAGERLLMEFSGILARKKPRGQGDG